MPELQQNVKALFGQALEIRSETERALYLDQACAGDANLRAEVVDLLDAFGRAGNFLGDTWPPEAPTELPLSEKPGTQIGPYKLLEQIGSGGMGSVFMAEQKEPIRRKVALKLIKPGMDTLQVVARFEAERQALAMMNHPSIAKVLDAGMTAAGRPFFVMELVKGAPITRFCDEQKLNTRQRLQLLITVCQAVQHAHQKGVIHRDLKPSNLLVEYHDVTPVPKVIDFGVAKAIGQRLTEKTLHTGFSDLVGTPLYMSPEQAGQSSIDVDTRSDIYSLGVLLYELLTGTTPFDKEILATAGYDEVRRVIREVDRPRPSARISTLQARALSTVSDRRNVTPLKLGQQLRGELDWIVMKALEKDRTRRYESASALAADLQRYLDNLTVEACPPSTLYRLTKFSRRHKGLLTAIVLVGVALVAGAAVSAWQAWEAMHARAVADEGLKSERHARAVAERESTRAGVFLDHALAAIDEMVSEMSEEKLVDVPQMDPLRRELLENALRLYQNLAKESQGEAKVELAVGNALQRLARVQDPSDALKSNRESIALFQGLVRQFPKEARYAAELAESHRLHGWALWHLGRLEESEEACRESVRLGAQGFGDLPDATMRIAQSKLILAYVLNIRQKHAEAEPILREVLPVHEDLFANSANYWWSLAVNLSLLGSAAERSGRIADAANYHQSGKAVAEKFLKLLSTGEAGPRQLPVERQVAPHDSTEVSGDLISGSRAMFFVVVSCKNLGVCHEAMGSLEDAEENYREASRIAAALVVDHPQVSSYAQWHRHSGEKLASLLQRAGREKEAARIIVEWPALTAKDLLTRAMAYEVLGDLAQARADQQASVELAAEGAAEVSRRGDLSRPANAHDWLPR